MLLNTMFKSIFSALHSSGNRSQTLLSRRTIHVVAVVFLIVVVALALHLGFGGPRSLSDASTIYQHVVNPKEEVDYWKWETTSRFQPQSKEEHGETPLHGHEIQQDHLCDTFPSYITSQIQITLKIGSSEPPDRVHAHISTVTRCIPNLIVVSDRESELDGHQVHDVLASYPSSFWNNTRDYEAYEALRRGDEKPIDGSKGWNLDRFKFLPMVERAREINPTAQWYVFLESDTYMFWDNMFRLLDQYDSRTPLYFGSPSPGRWDNDKKTYFAYGGAGFVLSAGAVDKLLKRKVGSLGEYTEPSFSMQFADLIKGDCCGDSVLGWALYKKGVTLSGLWPMFNPHALHGIPFNDGHWCQPPISLHRTKFADMKALTQFENQRDRTKPLLYADLMDLLKLDTLTEKTDWDNGDWGGFQEPQESPAHTSLAACRKACHDHSECFSYTYNASKQCIFVRSMRLGSQKINPAESQLSAGWDVESIKKWRESHQCSTPVWVKPSLKRIF